MGENGFLPPSKHDGATYNNFIAMMACISQARLAYDLARQHVWTTDGNQGAPPPMPDIDRIRMSAQELKNLERTEAERVANAAAWIAHHSKLAAEMAAKLPTGKPIHDARHTAQTSEGHDPSPDPIPVETPRARAEDWTDDVTWDGVEATQSPRDMMRSHLQECGRLDLLDLYDDEVIQYGPIVRRWINGQLR